MSDIGSLYQCVARNIIFLREQRGIKQYVLSDYLGISQPLLSQYETGKRRPSIETIQTISDYFNVPLKDFLFEDFDKETKKQTKASSDPKSIFDPIEKCSRSTYHVYYVQETTKKSSAGDKSIGTILMRIQEKTSSHSAKATLQYGNNGIRYDATVEMDESYAYIDCHDFKRDFYIHMMFYYYRNRPHLHYNGGIGLIQRIGCKQLPVAQLCAISPNQISVHKQEDLYQFLTVAERRNEKLTRQTFSSQSVMRLTKNIDVSFFDWLQANKYTVYSPSK